MEAKEKLTIFLESWKNRDFQEMFDSSQLSWASENYPNTLAVKFGHWQIEDFEVMEETPYEEEIVSDVSFRIKSKGIWTDPSTARVVREIGPFKASKDGKWGVNPISAMRILSKIKKGMY